MIPGRRAARATINPARPLHTRRDRIITALDLPSGEIHPREDETSAGTHSRRVSHPEVQPQPIPSVYANRLRPSPPLPMSLHGGSPRFLFSCVPQKLIKDLISA